MLRVIFKLEHNFQNKIAEELAEKRFEAKLIWKEPFPSYNSHSGYTTGIVVYIEQENLPALLRECQLELISISKEKFITKEEPPAWVKELFKPEYRERIRVYGDLKTYIEIIVSDLLSLDIDLVDGDYSIHPNTEYAVKHLNEIIDIAEIRNLVR